MLLQKALNAGKSAKVMDVLRTLTKKALEEAEDALLVQFDYLYYITTGT